MGKRQGLSKFAAQLALRTDLPRSQMGHLLSGAEIRERTSSWDGRMLLLRLAFAAGSVQHWLKLRWSEGQPFPAMNIVTRKDVQPGRFRNPARKTKSRRHPAVREHWRDGIQLAWRSAARAREIYYSSALSGL